MLNSRDVAQLRPDVASVCRQLVVQARQSGDDVLITGTVRDVEYQTDCYNKGYAKTKVPSFHSVRAGLAFDFCKNSKGHEYDDLEFFKRVGAIGKKLGLTWGGDWKSFVDRPHLQWDAKGAFTGTMIREGKYPPMIPEYAVALVTPVCKKLHSTSVQYWVDVLNGKVVPTPANMQALFEKINNI